MAKQWKPLRSSNHGNISFTYEILDNFFQHTNQYILILNLTSAANVVSDSQTELK
jgi:hypothetical protein